MKNLLKDLYIDKSLEREAGFNPYYSEITSGLDRLITIENRKIINLASNNYLGIANNSYIKRMVKKGIKKYGASLCGTPIATGYGAVFKSTQDRITKFTDNMDGVIFPSCYQLNMGIFSSFLTREDTVFFDHYIHSSLLEGIKSSGAKLRPFLHNDCDHLEKQLKKTGLEGRKVIVTESVFSTEGSIAPFDRIVYLANKYGAVPVVDDSHGIGVIGKGGRGILSHFNIENYQGIYLASLGKAIGNLGGYIGGPVNFIEFLKYSCSSFIYSTALVPPVLFGINGALDLIDRNFNKIIKRVYLYKREMEESLKENGIPYLESSTPIISIKTGDNKKTIMVSKKLYDKGILSTPFIYPSVPKNKGVVRLIPGGNLSYKSIKRVNTVFYELQNSF